MLRGSNKTLQLTERLDPEHLVFVVGNGLSARQKETAMIIELGKITLRTCGGGMTFREASANTCLLLRVDFLQDAC